MTMMYSLEIIASVTWNLVNIVNCMSKLRIMSNQGQGLLSHFYLGFVRCVLIRGPDIR